MVYAIIQDLFAIVVMIAALFGVVMLGGHSLQIAMHTKRWVGPDFVYDKATNPVGYRIVLWSYLLLSCALMFTSIWLAMAFCTKYLR